MVERIRIIDSGKASASSHMDRDKELLANLKKGEAILHLYEWEGVYPLTYGVFIRPEKFLVSNREELGMDAASRPTGGGFLFHHGDYAFSLLVSSEHPMHRNSILENYRSVNSLVLKVLNKIFRIEGTLSSDEDSHHSIESNCCMAKVSKYDVLMGNRKIGGAAQRTVKQGFLHQGSIFLSGSTTDFYYKFLLPEVADPIVSEINRCAFFPLGISAPSEDLVMARKEIKEKFIQIFSCEYL
ncbi:Octanoyltransferase LipM [Chlamydia avium]|nr:biotin/lipoate A/B ligase [Chlamydia avium]EPP35983.1 biotin/lipoate A/B ligase family protein [Chlamydia psittaci 10_743_SC13]EPP38447.1 biotin/lipoate A/B ligase family protein [Chlamydia avium]VVT42651.1 Octanoyltransferase LipM [Chlamydia avium]